MTSKSNEPFDELWERTIAKSNIVWKIYVNPMNGMTMIYPSKDREDFGYQGDANMPSFTGNSLRECLEKLDTWISSLF